MGVYSVLRWHQGPAKCQIAGSPVGSLRPSVVRGDLQPVDAHKNICNHIKERGQAARARGPRGPVGPLGIQLGLSPSSPRTPRRDGTSPACTRGREVPFKLHLLFFP